jgi:outer membrane protein
MRRLLVLLPAALLISFSTPAMALPGFEAGVRGMYWFPDLAATAQTTTAGIPETKIDVQDDLGVGDENFLSGEAFARFGRVTLRLGYTPIRFEGNKTLTRTIEFGGETFSGSDNVISRLDVDMLDAELQVDILRHDLIAASFYLGLIGKVKYVDGKVELTSSALTERRDFKAPIPMIGLAAGAGFVNNLVRVDARVTGMAYSGNHLYEADAFASLCPFPFFRIQGGYRYIELKADENDIVADLKLKGPYVGAQLSF